MTTTQDHPAVRGHLARLHEVAMSLDPLRRIELVDEIRGHIDVRPASGRRRRRRRGDRERAGDDDPAARLRRTGRPPRSGD